MIAADTQITNKNVSAANWLVGCDWLKKTQTEKP